MKKTIAPKAVIFDLDGVLIDTAQYHKQSWLDLAEKEGWDYSEEFFYQTFGMQNAQIIPQILSRPIPADELQRLSDWKEQRYRDLIAGHLTPAPGARQLLDDLKAHAFKLAVGSSTPRVNLEFTMTHTGLADYFDTFVTSNDVSRSKPAPDTFLHAARTLNVTPAACVVVEDAVQGVQAAKAARMAVIALTTTRKPQDLNEADRIVPDLTHLSANDFLQLLNRIT